MRRAADTGAATPPSFYLQVWRLVRRIPRGRLMTYGQIATLLGSPRAARAVGYALSHLDQAQVPWHRVINAEGKISVGGRVERPDLQRRRLEDEGIAFDADGRCALATLRWWPRGWAPDPALAALSARL